MTKYVSNPVITVGGIGDPDRYTLGKSTLIYDEGVYKIWYSGKPNLTDDFNICYAESLDGITWVKHGSAVLEKTGAGWENYYVGYPAVIKVGSTYHLWYTGFDGTNLRIGYASSTDGITWVRGSNNPVIDLGIGGEWDDVFCYCASVIYDDGTYKMWFTGSSNGSDANLGYATSTEPDDNWTKYGGNPVLVGEVGWEDSRVSNCDVKKLSDNIYYMAYSGEGVNNGKVGWATSSDGINWTKNVSNPIIDYGDEGEWDDTGCYAPGTIYVSSEGRFWIYYSGQGTSTHPKQIGLAYSPAITIFSLLLSG